MDRRRVLLTSLAGALAVPLAAVAQRAVPHVGFLAMGRHPSFEAFSSSLRDLGYVDGRNIVLEPRFAEIGRPEQFDELATDLVRRQVQVIVALINPEIVAARRATMTIPIVMVVGIDPVRQGLVQTLARPGGNVTGLTWDPGPEIYGKMVEFLGALLPRLRSISGLVDVAFPGTEPYWRAADEAARQHNVQLQRVEIRGPDDLEPAFATMKRGQTEAVLLFGGSMLFGARTQLAQLGLKGRLPIVSPYREAVEAGSLLSYGPSLPDLWRRAAIYVDKILKGAKPADLPVEQPTKFELVINLKTAKALGLTIPNSLLLRADQVIE